MKIFSVLPESARKRLTYKGLRRELGRKEKHGHVRSAQCKQDAGRTGWTRMFEMKSGSRSCRFLWQVAI